MIVALASDGDGGMPDGHFGHAPCFDLYRVQAGLAEKIATVINPNAGNEHHHAHDHHHHEQGDGHQGHGVGRLLAQHNAQVMVSRAFGQNIVRMRQRFLPVKVSVGTAEQAIALLQVNWDRVRQHWLDGEERKHLVLR